MRSKKNYKILLNKEELRAFKKWINTNPDIPFDISPYDYFLNRVVKAPNKHSEATKEERYIITPIKKQLNLSDFK